MAKWGEIKCPRCEELEAKLATCEKYRDAYAEMDRIGTQAVRDLEAKLRKSALQELSALGQASEAYQAQLAAEAKLAKAVVALRGWIDFANKEGMPVLLSDLEAAGLTGGKDE